MILILHSPLVHVHVSVNIFVDAFSILRICLDVFQKTSCVSLFTIQEAFKFYKVDIQMPFTTALF